MITFATVLRAFTNEVDAESDRIAASIARWDADVASAVAQCKPDASPQVHHAASVIGRIDHQVDDAEAVLLLGAVFAKLHAAGNHHLAARQDAMACISDAIEELLAEAVRRREGTGA